MHLQPFTSYSEILVGNCNFFYPLALNASVGVPIGIPGKSFVLIKLESWGYQAVRPFDDRLSRFDAIPVCDGRMDRRLAQSHRYGSGPAYSYYVLQHMVADARKNDRATVSIYIVPRKVTCYFL